MLFLQASSLSKPDISIILPPNKTHLIHLENIFQGNNLYFKIKCNEGTKKYNILQSPLELSTFQSKNIDSNVTASIKQYQMPSFNF